MHVHLRKSTRLPMTNRTQKLYNKTTTTPMTCNNDNNDTDFRRISQSKRHFLNTCVEIPVTIWIRKILLKKQDTQPNAVNKHVKIGRILK